MTTVLRIQREIWEQLIEHARQDAPIEACGYLAEQDGVVASLYRLRNVEASPEHFSLDAAEQFAVVRQMRAGRQRLRAVYHCHPATPARPSAEDVRLSNDPDLSYVIVSLASPDPEVNSFLIRFGEVLPEPLEIVENP